MATFISKEGLKKEITSPGEYTIGRGPLLEITDKRVSRKHAILKIEEDGTVKFCLRHDNPCYHKPAKSNDFIQLKCDTWQELTDDDQISLLHHSIEELVFTVRINSIKGTTNAPNDDNVELTTSDSNKCALGEEQKMATPPMPLVTSSSSSGKSRKLPSWLLAAKNDGKPTATSKQKSTSRSTGSKLLNKTSSSSAGSRKVSSSSSVGDEPVKKEEDIPTATTTTTSTTIASNTPAATSTTTFTTIASNIPAATSTTTSTPATISTSNTATSTSNTATSTSNTPAATTIPSATSTGTGSDDVLAADDSSRLPSCPYGKKCYRKNPAHFKEYSHSDPDDEEDDKPECPYGMSCYRKNSLHRQQYKHTADTTSDNSIPSLTVRINHYCYRRYKENSK
jgi:aprataxin and PNK-like factor